MSGLSIAAYFPFARFKVVNQTVHRETDTPAALIYIKPDQRYRPLCHACGRRADGIHSHGYRRVLRDLAVADTEVWLQVQYRKVWCQDCGKARVEHLGFADASQRVTRRLARYVYELRKVLTIAEVAHQVNLDPKTVKAIDMHFLEQEFGVTDYTDLMVLAVDEIALKKGQLGYMTVVLDYLSGRVVWMGEGRKSDTLDGFFAGMTQEQKKAIQAVAMDMWEPFIKSVKTHCPQVRIVFDLFHLVKGYGEVIDEVRRREFRQADPAHREWIKGSRYLLLRNAENLKDTQRQRLEQLLKANRTLSAVYILKDQLKAVYRYRQPAACRRALSQWCAMAESIDHPLMRRFIGRLRFFEEGIVNHSHCPIGTSPLEGVNNRIKVIKRDAYGFHDPRYFALKVKQAFPGVDVKRNNFLG